MSVTGPDALFSGAMTFSFGSSPIVTASGKFKNTDSVDMGGGNDSVSIGGVCKYWYTFVCRF